MSTPSADNNPPPDNKFVHCLDGPSIRIGPEDYTCIVTGEWTGVIPAPLQPDVSRGYFDTGFQVIEGSPSEGGGPVANGRASRRYYGPAEYRSIFIKHAMGYFYRDKTVSGGAGCETKWVRGPWYPDITASASSSECYPNMLPTSFTVEYESAPRDVLNMRECEDARWLVGEGPSLGEDWCGCVVVINYESKFTYWPYLRPLIYPVSDSFNSPCQIELPRWPDGWGLTTPDPLDSVASKPCSWIEVDRKTEFEALPIEEGVIYIEDEPDGKLPQDYHPVLRIQTTTFNTRWCNVISPDIPYLEDMSGSVSGNTPFGYPKESVFFSLDNVIPYTDVMRRFPTYCLEMRFVVKLTVGNDCIEELDEDTCKPKSGPVLIRGNGSRWNKIWRPKTQDIACGGAADTNWWDLSVEQPSGTPGAGGPGGFSKPFEVKDWTVNNGGAGDPDVNKNLFRKSSLTCWPN